MNRVTLSLIASIFLLNSVYADEKLEDITVITTATKTEKNIDGVSASAKSKSSISIRGMGATNTLFLIDGKRLSGEVSNPYDMDRIPASIIERVEIVKGAMSSLYGADAVGGVINIITKKPKEKFQGNFGVKYGANTKNDGSNRDINLNFRGSNGKFRYSIYGSQLHSTPYTQKEKTNVLVKTPTGKVPPSQHPHPILHNIKDKYSTDVTYREEADISNIGTRLEYQFTDNLTMGLDLSYMDEEREGAYNSIFHPSGIKTQDGKPIPTFNAPVNSKDDNTRRNIGADIKWNATDDLGFDFKVYNSYYEKRNTTTLKHYRDFGFDNEAQSGANGMNANVDITSYELMSNYAINDEHLLTIGTEYRDEKRDSSVFTFGKNMTQESVDYQALYLQDEWEISDTLNIIAGGRYDAISNAEDKPTFRLGVVKNIDGGVNLRANFAQAYRTPDIREMYIHKQTPAGMMIGADHTGYNLKPEFTNSYEVAMGGKRGKFDYDIALFFNQIEDRIEQVQGDKPHSFTFKNVSKAETKGVEAQLGYEFDNGVTTNLTWNELDSENRDTGKSLEFTPDRTISANIDIPLNKNLKIGALATYIGEQEYSDVVIKKINNKPSKVKIDKNTDAYTLVDLTASYSFGDKNQYKINGGVNNLFDEKVDNRLGSTVGTYTFVGASIDF